MRQVRATDLTNAALVDGRGKRSPQTRLLIDERDKLLREVARRFCVGMSDRQAAAMLHAKLSRYRECAWRRERTAVECPARHRGTISEALWCLLKVRDATPSERSIRRAFRGPRDGV